MPLTEQRGDILTTNTEYIVQQCNCVSTHPHGLSDAISGKYSYANIYAERGRNGGRGTPGTIMVRGNGEDERFVINMLGQYYPPGRGERYPNDTFEMREQWFQSCLGDIPGLQSITFPFCIGCVLSKGN